MTRPPLELKVGSGRALAFISAVFTLVTTGCLVGSIVLLRTRAGHSFDCFNRRAVDVSCVRDAVSAGQDARPVQLAENIFGALSCFTLLPVVWLLHDFYATTGSRSNVMLPAFAAAAMLRLLELTFRAGVAMEASYLVEDWTLSDADLRSLLIAFETTESQGTWLWGLDYLLLGVGLITASFCAYDTPKFHRFWAHLGVFAGTVSVIIFILSFVRLTDYKLLLTSSGILMGIDGFILLPLWVVGLGMSLHTVKYDLDF